MTTEENTQLKGWLDIIIKGVIGLIVTLIGWDYKNLKDALSGLQNSKYELTTQVEVARYEIAHIKNSLDRIEKKLDEWRR